MSIATICRRDVQQAQPGECVTTAAARMKEHGVGTLVVVDAQHRPIGIVTDRDLALRVLGEGREPQRTRVLDVMTSHPRTLAPENSLEEALAAMRTLCVRRLPVVGPKGELIGVVSVDDLLAALAGELGGLSQMLVRRPGEVVPLAAPKARKGRLSGLERAASDPEC
jgi:CBS domain-containing protein